MTNSHSPALPSPLEAQLRSALKTHWGYDEFRALQLESMTHVMQHQDSVVILPTGGGKSLCYQVPAVCLDGVAVIVSPLISLMKDQVDALRASGVPAAFINSTLTLEEKRVIARDLANKKLKLVYVAPERLVVEPLLTRIEEAGVSFFAIDEAHCVSQWGHDFRPHYRQLSILRERFPTTGVHAFTATASQRVRDDIAEQLHLREPQQIIGSFDRPNLIYRVERRGKLLDQISPVLDRHRDESGIIYCISRKEVETLSAQLNALGYSSRPYHAGLSDEERDKNQEAFIRDKIQIIVATVAFGMGIDKPDVRYVIHAGIPKSIEHYQQETGRAGRDGLEAECWMFYGGKDLQTWDYIFATQPPDVQVASRLSLRGMLDYADGVLCRHRLLVRHFGQDLDEDCSDRCDICQGEITFVSEPLPIAQKILSSIYRQGERFGSEYTARVVTAQPDDRVTRNGHDKLTTYGLLQEHSILQVQDWIGDLVRQGHLIRMDEYQILKITESGWRVLKGLEIPVLRQQSELQADQSPRRRKEKKSKVDSADSWVGVDRPLFEELKKLRMEFATERGVPPYIIFGDATLRELARYRPTTIARFLAIRGVGERKCEDFGGRFIARIEEFCIAAGLQTDLTEPDVTVSAPAPAPARSKEVPSGAALRAFPLFDEGMSPEQVAGEMGRAKSTTQGYYLEYLRHKRITEVPSWIAPEIEDHVVAAQQALGPEETRLTPLFEALNKEVDYDTLRIVLACHRNRADAPGDNS
jgi:ATP-dependent DNA helicase RecQ